MKMQKKEMNIFIEETSKVDDIWTEEQVKEVYQGVSLQKALNEREKSYDKIADIIHGVVNA